jgi:hypothetical protein
MEVDTSSDPPNPEIFSQEPFMSISIARNPTNDGLNTPYNYIVT